VFSAIIRKNIGKGRSDDCAEAAIAQRPWGVFARGATSEVFRCQKDACAFVARCIENELRIRRAVGRKAPVIEEELPEAGAFDALQELLGNDLVGIDVDAIERDNDS